MNIQNSYEELLLEKIQNIITALNGGDPTVNNNYENIHSFFWKWLFEKLDIIIIAIASITPGSGGNYENLPNKPAIDGNILNKDSTAAGLGLETASLPYKGANNHAGILVDMGMDVPGGTEILFDILYNETQSGFLKRQSHIHGHFYGGLDIRTGMVQNGNVPVPVFAFRGTEEGTGNINIYMWIPSSNTDYFPSAKVEAWYQTVSGFSFNKFPATISTLAAEPAETMIEITDITPWSAV
jgi:hypothetical protein